MNKVYKCKCGQALNFNPCDSPTLEKRVCPNCKRRNYVDDAPIDWMRVAEISCQVYEAERLYRRNSCKQ